jgi:hypothetical protein
MTQKVVTNDEAVTGSKKFFFAILGTFGRYITNLRGTFVENVKKVENQPTLLYSRIVKMSFYYYYPFKYPTQSLLSPKLNLNFLF